jgi:hypothetical protein
MSTSDVLRIVKDRGLRIELRDGRPVLIRPEKAEVTGKLLAVLAIHRERIIEFLRKPE